LVSWPRIRSANVKWVRGKKKKGEGRRSQSLADKELSIVKLKSTDVKPALETNSKMKKKVNCLGVRRKNIKSAAGSGGRGG